MSMNQNASANSAGREKSPYAPHVASDAINSTAPSAFARVGAKLVDAGFSAIPCAPGLKVPGSYGRGEWRRMPDWTRYAERSPTQIELDIWDRWPDAGVCIVLGGPLDAPEQLVAVDVDSTDERIVEALRDVLPAGLVEKCGAKGYTGFYRAPQAVVTRTFDVDSIRAVDLLARGRQTVIPPSLHPQTGRPYVWTTTLSLADVTLDRLPLLPDDIVERLSAALAPFGTIAVSEPVRRYDEDYCGPWTETNDAALDNFDAWLPLLGVQAKRERDGSYRGPAVWRGGDNPTSISYDHRGIRDFKMNEGLTPLDVVQRAGAAEGDWNADNWLCEKLGLPVLPFVKFEFGPLFGREFAGVISIPYHGSKWGEGIVYVEPSRAVAIELGEGVDCTKPDGLLGWITDWTLSQMRRPNRPLAVAAAVATMAPVCGWRNIYSPTGCSLNVYIAALAPTAVGKDAMLKAPGRILKTVRAAKRLYSSSDAFSLSAQEKILYDHRAIVLALDEVATNMFPRMFSARASAHESSLKGMQMKLWERNIGDPGYGFTARGPNSQVQYEDLDNPSFSMLVANTPGTFWESLPKEAIANGYLNRWLLIAAAARESQDVVHSEAPEEIVESPARNRQRRRSGKSRPSWRRRTLHAAVGRRRRQGRLDSNGKQHPALLGRRDSRRLPDGANCRIRRSAGVATRGRLPRGACRCRDG
jgi:Bifunctional DNA primase/polymerase, N-terminal